MKVGGLSETRCCLFLETAGESVCGAGGRREAKHLCRPHPEAPGCFGVSFCITNCWRKPWVLNTASADPTKPGLAQAEGQRGHFSGGPRVASGAQDKRWGSGKLLGNDLVNNAKA